jgi:hypothetical protein
MLLAQMETFYLLHLARLSAEPILVSAAAMALANRHTGAVIDAADIQLLEARGGAAVLRAITTVQLDQ